jgi:peptidoglycan hydrolase CwlO-like protein
MRKSRRARHNKRRAGVKNTTLKAQKKEEALILKELKALKAAQKKEEAQILKDVKAQKKEEKARIKEEKARIKEEKAIVKALKKTKKAQPKTKSKTVTPAKPSRAKAKASVVPVLNVDDSDSDE